jgi:hypothetical protein
MPAPCPGTDLIRLRVAELRLALDARGTTISMAVPPAHAKFLTESEGGLELAVRSGPLRATNAWRPLYNSPETWQFWQDEAGRYILAAGQNATLGRQVTFDAGFRSGEVLGPFGDGACPAEPFYPLQGLDIILFVNWLAESGGLILHASGIEADGRGYCLAGASGAGKSTLAAALLGAPGVTVMGEDNLVLRYREDRFWIYGTPWHLDPARCSPVGAPLEKLFFLDRSAATGVRPCAPADGIARLLQTAFVPYYRPEAVARIVDKLARLAERVPFYTLSYRLGSDPMELLRDA